MSPLIAFLSPGSLNHIANIIKGFAIAIGIALAIGFVWAWWSARLRERRVEIAVRARNAYATYLKSAIQHPDLSEPLLGALVNPVEIVRYKQFVASLLNVAAEILLLDPTPAWSETLARQLAPHASYLASEEFRSGALKDCTPAVRALIEAQAKGGAAAG